MGVKLGHLMGSGLSSFTAKAMAEIPCSCHPTYMQATSVRSARFFTGHNLYLSNTRKYFEHENREGSKIVVLAPLARFG
jgi:hypothetical protein